MQNNVLGKWEGTYTYLHNDVENRVGGFILEVTELNDKNQFIGIVIDVIENNNSTIRGKFITPEIEFIKTYNSIKVPIEGKIVNLNTKHHINYLGDLVNGNQFFGTWFRKEQKVVYEGKVYTIFSEHGAWSATRIL